MNKYAWSQDGAVAERLEAIEEALLTIANILSDITTNDNPRGLKTISIKEEEDE